MSKSFKLFAFFLFVIILGFVITYGGAVYNLLEQVSGNDQYCTSTIDGSLLDKNLQNIYDCKPPMPSKNGLPVSFYKSPYESFTSYVKSYKSRGVTDSEDNFSPVKFAVDWVIWSTATGTIIIFTNKLRHKRAHNRD